MHGVSSFICLHLRKLKVLVHLSLEQEAPLLSPCYYNNAKHSIKKAVLFKFPASIMRVHSFPGGSGTSYWSCFYWRLGGAAGRARLGRAPSELRRDVAATGPLPGSPAPSGSRGADPVQAINILLIGNLIMMEDPG